ncbi:18572_t:CDS:2, partial [Racocetra fulgida]
SSSSEATSSKDESEVEDKSIKKRRDRSVSKRKGRLDIKDSAQVEAQVEALAGLIAVAAVQ